MTPTTIDRPRSERAFGAERHLEHHAVRTGDGWVLQLTRVVRPGQPAGQPVLFIPGYGMNAWIVQYHPRGRSFADVLLEGGFDPWGVDLRGTSTSKGPTRPSFQAMSTHDVPAAIDYIRTLRSAERVHVTYVRGGRTERVRARRVVLACWNMVIPHLCPELPAVQREALASLVKIPLVFTSVLLREWRAGERKDDDILDALFTTVNGIARGIQNTG